MRKVSTEIFLITLLSEIGSLALTQSVQTYTLIMGRDSITLYDKNFVARNLPTILDWPNNNWETVLGGMVGGKIVICVNKKCYSWSKDHPSKWRYEFTTKDINTSGQTFVTTKTGIWIAGGYKVKETYLLTVDSGTGKVKYETTNMFLKDRMNHCIIENGNSPIVTGGYDERLYSERKSVQKYDLSTGRVSKLPDLNIPRFAHGCSRFQQHTSETKWSYIVGGGWNGVGLDSIEILYPAADKWIVIDNLPDPRWFLTMANLNNKVNYEQLIKQYFQAISFSFPILSGGALRLFKCEIVELKFKFLLICDISLEDRILNSRICQSLAPFLYVYPSLSIKFFNIVQETQFKQKIKRHFRKALMEIVLIVFES